METQSLKKLGAGLLVVSDGEILLLLRGPDSGNPNTWGLPGGNQEKGETPIATALREATEELGQVIPNYSIKAEISTMRGKNRNKKFIVFVAEISPGDKKSFKPKLNEEHVEFQWFALSDIPGIPNLHPIVKILFQDHSQEISDALTEASL